ncbi:hypothetical protein BAUCODRAFT_519967 [Baudoinia panamericana UAMH 10762]|uniref:Uncharacterized protein n=1 Tax=Baudoinia panamericana (strain UAMH 10762) TaxID=717646 RepID=M2N798_BAUPA|nr:uncharacterized protein BAUCODRAFT_519967 [Baudoinia panamericana UAMH 10762]EMC94949.1 hypothetical protein BAUCODRAFT_519967 [Baudoinia panamericana UAMH 10762]
MALSDPPSKDQITDRPLRRRDHQSIRDAQTNSNTKHDISKDDGIFRFFDLPREMRDQIYDESLTFKQKYQSQHGIRLRGRRVVNPALLLVSKQFHQEYVERADRKTTLVIVDRNVYHGELLEVSKLPKQLTCATKLEIHLALACNGEADHITNGCRVLKELRMHRKWIVDLVRKMRRIGAIEIKVVLDPRDQGSVCERKFIELQYLFTNVEELQRLEVFHADYGMTGADWNFQKSRELVMEWTQGACEVRRVEMPSVKGEASSMGSVSGKED